VGNDGGSSCRFFPPRRIGETPKGHACETRIYSPFSPPPSPTSTPEYSFDDSVPPSFFPPLLPSIPSSHSIGMQSALVGHHTDHSTVVAVGTKQTSPLFSLPPPATRDSWRNIRGQQRYLRDPQRDGGCVSARPLPPSPPPDASQVKLAKRASLISNLFPPPSTTCASTPVKENRGNDYGLVDTVYFPLSVEKEVGRKGQLPFLPSRAGQSGGRLWKEVGESTRGPLPFSSEERRDLSFSPPIPGYDLPQKAGGLERENFFPPPSPGGPISRPQTTINDRADFRLPLVPLRRSPREGPARSSDRGITFFPSFSLPQRFFAEYTP